MKKRFSARRGVLSPRIRVLFLLAIPAVVLLLPLRLLAHPLPRAVGFLLAAYILLCLLFRLPRLFSRFRAFFEQQPDAGSAWVRFTVLGGFLLNLLYALFRLWAGIQTRSLWFCGEGVYYVLLGVIRAFLIESEHAAHSASQRYRQGGRMLALLTVTMLGIVLLALREERVQDFSNLIVVGSVLFATWRVFAATYYLVRFRHKNEPFLLCAKMLSLCAATLSLFALQGTLLLRFAVDTQTRALWNALTGGGTLLTTAAMAAILFRKAKMHR